MFIIEQYDTELNVWEIVAEDVDKFSDASTIFLKMVDEGIDCRMEYVKMVKKNVTDKRPLSPSTQ